MALVLRVIESDIEMKPIVSQGLRRLLSVVVAPCYQHDGGVDNRLPQLHTTKARAWTLQ